MINHASNKIDQKFITNWEMIDNAQIDKDYIAKLQNTSKHKYEGDVIFVV